MVGAKISRQKSIILLPPGNIIMGAIISRYTGSNPLESQDHVTAVVTRDYFNVKNALMRKRVSHFYLRSKD